VAIVATYTYCCLAALPALTLCTNPTLPYPTPPPYPYYKTLTPALLVFLRSGRAERRRAQIAWGDMFAQPLADADVVMIFGVTPLMKGEYTVCVVMNRVLLVFASLLEYTCFPLPLTSRWSRI